MGLTGPKKGVRAPGAGVPQELDRQVALIVNFALKGGRLDVWIVVLELAFEQGIRFKLEMRLDRRQAGVGGKVRERARNRAAQRRFDFAIDLIVGG